LAASSTSRRRSKFWLLPTPEVKEAASDGDASGEDFGSIMRRVLSVDDALK
jgi:hypothetical protein